MLSLATRAAPWITPAISRRPSSCLCHWQRRRRHWYTTTSGKESDPLRILFCGTDDISTRSLYALHREWKRNRGLVEAIEVVCMPPKPSGRGLKKLSPVPVMRAAEELGLAYHQIPTFTGWKMPTGINLVVAVSFGLFVPPRILGGAKYGGLNVHPSWLPDLRGPAPTLHAMLRGDEYMGASLQTLDDKRFDHGMILAQTPRPGVRIAEGTPLKEINGLMATEGADLLVNGLRSGVHVPPHVDGGWMAGELGDRPLQHAPKMSKAATQVDWTAWKAVDWRRRLQISRAVWTTIRVPQQAGEGASKERRVIFHDAREVPVTEVTGQRATLEAVYREGGGKGEQHERVLSLDRGTGDVFLLLPGNTWICCQRATLEGKPERAAATALKDLVVVKDEWSK